MAFSLPPLPYSDDALAPQISQETVQFHYGKHHATYVNKLNVGIKDTAFANESCLTNVMLNSDKGVFNNAAQTWNHTFYWNCLKSNKERKPNHPPKGSLVEEEICKSFGSFEKFLEDFKGECLAHFGSGWLWVVYCPNSKTLKLFQGHDAVNPLAQKVGFPILTCDLWEHAFYVDYRNDKATYVNSYLELIDWDFVNEQLKIAAKGESTQKAGCCVKQC